MEASPPWVRMTRPYEHTVEAVSKDGLKRKCADRAASPWNKRRRITSPPLPSSESPSPSSLSSSTSISTSRNIDLDRWSFGRSLSAILKEHNRTRLYVPPIAWTSTHLKLLLVQFNRNPQPDVCGHACRDDDCAPHKHEVLRAARQLRCENAKAQQIAMSEIMQHYNFKSHKTKCLELCYGGKNVTRVLADGVFKAHSGFRRLACINLGTIQALRKKYIQQRNPMYRKQRNMQMRNEPVAGLRDIKLRRIEPRVEAEDPYILGILIALAEAQRQERKTDDNAADNGGVAVEKVFGIAFPIIRAQVAYFYKAAIPHAFLQKLGNPHEAVRCEGFVVSYVSVSLAVPEEALNHLVQLFCSNNMLHCAKAQ